MGRGYAFPVGLSSPDGREMDWLGSLYPLCGGYLGVRWEHEADPDVFVSFLVEADPPEKPEGTWPRGRV